LALIFVTRNDHKFLEARELALRFGLEIVQSKTEYDEIQSDSLVEIVRRGAKDACLKLGTPCFVEDAGLFIESLNGFPGPYSKFVFSTIGNAGVLKLMEGAPDRSAEFRSAVGFCEPGGEPTVFTGTCRGKIAVEARGAGGFGFDPIFEPEGGGGRTFAEMSVEEKNKFSHRGKALAAFMEWFKGKKSAES
jgi:XTP/dITP diphosphohydrolase